MGTLDEIALIYLRWRDGNKTVVTLPYRLRRLYCDRAISIFVDDSVIPYWTSLRSLLLFLLLVLLLLSKVGLLGGALRLRR